MANSSSNSQNNNSNNNTSSSVDKLSTGFSNVSKPNEADVDALNKRGSNTAEHSSSFRRRNEYPDQDDDKGSKKPSELGEKDGLDDKDGLKEKDDKKSDGEKSDGKKHSLKDNIGNGIKDKLFGEESTIGKLKKSWAKAILFGKIAIIGGAIFIVILLLVAFFLTIGKAFNAISSFFGIPTVDSQENMSINDSDGLMQQEDYLYDYSTGEGYQTMDELVDALKEDNSCSKITFWNGIGDWFDRIDGKFGNVCGYLRYIERQEEALEKNNPGLTLDRALIISSIFYGYASQPGYSQMENPELVDDYINSMEYFESLKDVLESGTIKRKDLDKIIENSAAFTSHYFYTWDIEDEYDKNGNLKSSTGVCKETYVQDVRYNITKWNVFMRFGEDAAKKYESELLKKKAYDESSEECTGKITDSELLELVASHGASDTSLDKTVSKAQDYLVDDPISGLDLFEQAATTTGKDKDVFTPYQRENVYVEFDYRNGFMYKKFPDFEQSINDPNVEIKYDDAITPKEVETIRSLIVERKPDLNDILHFVDQDEPYRYLYNADTETSVVLGAFCGDYLTAPIDQIKVAVKDCDGRTLTTTTMKEYVMGVAFREVSNKEDDYVKAEMVAALSYALHRRSNYTKGTVITMRSGNCDQAYCPMTMGCHSEKAALSCGSFKCTSYIPGPGGGTNTPAASQSLISTYDAYYEEIKDFLIVNGSTIFGVHYVSSIQNEWYRKAASGMSYTQIIQETYASEGGTLIRCSQTNDGTNSTSSTTTADSSTTTNNSETKYGNGVVAGKYTEIAPDLGEYYGFSYKRSDKNQQVEINPAWVQANITTINSNCSQAGWTEDYQVNVHAKENYKQAFSNVCKLLTTGVKLSDGTTCKYNKDNLSGGSTFVQRETIGGMISDVAYGITQDWNYDKTYSINGENYSPYDSTRSLEDYLKFVKALGKEEDCRNVNYILYKYAYEPAGFTWGGNNGRNGNSGTFNGMHFRINY